MYFIFSLTKGIEQTVDESIEWAIMDIEPLPFYVKGSVALIGDAVSVHPQKKRQSKHSDPKYQAHAAVPYLGMSAACAIEVRLRTPPSPPSPLKKPSFRRTTHTTSHQDAYVLARILRASITTRTSLPLALEAYQAVRRPYGNKHVIDARLVLHEFQYNAPHGGDMTRIREAIRKFFEENAGIGRGQTGPDADANRGVFWMEVQLRTLRMPS